MCTERAKCRPVDDAIRLTKLAVFEPTVYEAMSGVHERLASDYQIAQQPLFL